MNTGVELFRTCVDTGCPVWKIVPSHRMLFVGSCFAASMGKLFTDNCFQTLVNPYGVMYNPASVLHTLERLSQEDNLFQPDVAIVTLGTNHVYILKESGLIVDNCNKQPHHLFREEELSVEQCRRYLERCVQLLRQMNSQVHIIFTVSPIRYAKYGFHGSQLSKATLLLACHELLQGEQAMDYFPAYEIVNDELRDYRFYASDMLHPSEQAVDYIFRRFAQAYFSEEAVRFVDDWQPLAKALAHRPLHPGSAEHERFLEATRRQLSAFREKYPFTGEPAPMPLTSFEAPGPHTQP